MSPKIAAHDLELISAYLDGQLKPKEQASLEAKLTADPTLRAELDDLQRLHTALWRLPRLRAPRRFTLTPEMVAARQARPLFPVFGFASALASLVLILVLMIDLLGAAVPIAPAQSVAKEMTPVEILGIETAENVSEKIAADSAPQAMPETTTSLPQVPTATVTATPTVQPSATLTEGILNETFGMAQTQPPADLVPTYREVPITGTGLESTPTLEMALKMAPVPTETLSTPPEIQFDSAQTTTVATDAPTVVVIVVTPSEPPAVAMAATEQPFDAAQSAKQATETQPARTGHIVIRMIEIVLAMLVFVSSLVAIYLYRKSS